MTTAGFDRLLYTDCRAGTGRGAGGGFQVQAQSAGVDAGQSKLAVGWLLYDAPNAWIVQQRPVADFPLGFAHASGEGFGTAQSRYVGTEATGARQGNHLADCLLTRDPERYGATRPAQLWRSPLWRSEPWDTTECPALDEPPPLGPLTVDEVAQWLQAGPARQQVLARLVSVLEDPVGPRVVITSDGPGEAMMWIAAATLMLPAREALQVSFKVFCANPQRSDHRIVAVPRELNPQVVPGRGDSVFVLDANQARSDEAGISERSRFWVGQLVSVEDPYDVIDGIELAWQLSDGKPGDWPEARVTAWSLTAPSASPPSPEALFGWLTSAAPTSLQDHGASAAQQLMATSPSAEVMRWLDNAARLERFEADRQPIREQLLTAEIAEIRAGIWPPADKLAPVIPRGTAGAIARRDADSELTSAILLGSDSEVDWLLRLAWRHGIQLQVGPLQRRLWDFAATWVNDPARDYDPGQWALGQEILDSVRDQLQAGMTSYGQAWLRRPLTCLWRYFRDGADTSLSDPLACHICVAGLRELSSQQRRSQLDGLIRQACQDPGSSEAAMANLQQALIDWGLLGTYEAVRVTRSLPSRVPVSQVALELVIADLERSPRISAGMLDLIANLQRRHQAPHRPPFTGLIRADQIVQRFVDASQTEEFRASATVITDHVGLLRRTEPEVLEARLPLLLQTCLEFPYHELGAAVIGILAEPIRLKMISLWSRELGGQQGIRAACMGVFWAADPVLEDVRPVFATLFREYGSQLDPEARENWVARVQEAIGDDQSANWAELSGSRSRLGRLFRGKSAGS
jgi:hypothetical protein